MLENKPYNKTTKKYLQYAFRVEKKEMAWIKSQLEELHKKLNKDRDPKTESVIKYNQIILEALKIGFAELLRGSGKR